jgi:hypothetical protein
MIGVRRRIRFAAAALALAAAGGCERPNEPVRAALGMPAPHVAAPYAGGPLRVTEAGVGPVTQETPFSADAIAALFPEAEVTTRTAPEGYALQPVILVRQTGLGMRIEGDAEKAVITRVLVWGDNALGPNGERLADTGGPKSFSPAQCRVRPNTALLTAVCRRTPDSHVSLTYTVGEFAPPRRAAADHDELIAHGFLAYIMWERSPPPVPSGPN